MKISTLISAFLFVASSIMAATTHGTLVDKRDGKEYRTVKIGNQMWMAENLNYKAQGSYCYEEDESNCSKYGRLYEWKAAIKACPDGWHLPSMAEFGALFNSVGGRQVAGKSLKSKVGWNNGGNGVDAFWFSALPAGVRTYKGDFLEEGNFAHYWSSTKASDYDAFYVYLNLGVDDAIRFFNDMLVGFSVRCLQDDDGLVESNSSAGTLVDTRDGKKYRTIKIGNQTWIAENLNYETRDSYCYQDDEINCSKYGRFYKWNAAIKACPSGWHLPSKAEFETLFNSVGGRQVAGKSLKSKKGWKNGGDGTDAFGFSALPAGDVDDNGLYGHEGLAYFWSSTEYNSNDAYDMYLYFNDVSANLFRTSKYGVSSVRCVMD
ncbi:fibrobacter succinogenes major paralogous domain-containing protein [uncultured Fibrobacter sp.]|uniref:fibrobacter succinogenes major paralogous domain-containing protein n=1 Tax=uncultured Fibrobacter sp. TaxID=261512 RepID=UPI0025E741F2|nr:fibrobacter succinogenes major paralogous domain-containing protein [uncultured Fibrobacter sp.]